MFQGRQGQPWRRAGGCEDSKAGGSHDRPLTCHRSNMSFLARIPNSFPRTCVHVRHTERRGFKEGTRPPHAIDKRSQNKQAIVQASEVTGKALWADPGKSQVRTTTTTTPLHFQCGCLGGGHQQQNNSLPYTHSLVRERRDSEDLCPPKISHLIERCGRSPSTLAQTNRPGLNRPLRPGTGKARPSSNHHRHPPPPRQNPGK